MKKASFITAAAAILALLPVSGAFAQVSKPFNPYPNREQKVIEGFETASVCTEDQFNNDECPSGFTTAKSDATKHATLSINTDAKYVAEGSKSLKVDMKGVEGNWHSEFFRGTFAQPVDVAGYHTISMQVYWPYDNTDPDNIIAANPQWSQIFLKVDTVNNDGGTNTDWYNNRDFHKGWNYFTWDLWDYPEGMKITGIEVGGNAGDVWGAPLYFDDVRLIKDAFPGVHPDEKVIQGFDTQDIVDLAKTNDQNSPATLYNKTTAGADFNPAFVKDGGGSLQIDMVNSAGDPLGQGWYNNWFTITDLPFPDGVDLSKATALELDVYVPSTTVADLDWWQVGFHVDGTPPEGGNGYADSSVTQHLPDRWNTLVIPLVTDPNVPNETPDAFRLTNVTKLELRRNSGRNDGNTDTTWNGPIYIDNLRAVIPTTPPVGCKGDVNGSKGVDVSDAVAILQHVVGIGTPLSGDNLANANVNGDNGVDVADAVAILQAVVGVSPGKDLITKLACG